MCMMCMILSPNRCTVTIFEYSSTDVTLPSCLSVLSEHVASQSKWRSADLGVYLGVKTCEVFLCFVAIVRVRAIVLTSLFSLFYVTGEGHRFLHRG